MLPAPPPDPCPRPSTSSVACFFLNRRKSYPILAGTNPHFSQFYHRRKCGHLDVACSLRLHRANVCRLLTLFFFEASGSLSHVGGWMSNHRSQFTGGGGAPARL